MTITPDMRDEALLRMAANPYCPPVFSARALCVVGGEALDTVDEYILDLLDRGRFLGMTGNPGCGKTFAVWYALELGVILYRAKLTQRYPQCRRVIRFGTLPKLRIDDNNGFEDTIADQHMLAINEVGAETGSDKGWNIETLELLLDFRYERGLPTLLTTNLTGADFTARYGDRIADRIAEWGVFIGIGEDSWRERGDLPQVRFLPEPEEHVPAMDMDAGRQRIREMLGNITQQQRSRQRQDQEAEQRQELLDERFGQAQPDEAVMGARE